MNTDVKLSSCPFCGQIPTLVPSKHGEYSSIVCKDKTLCPGPLVSVIPNDRISEGVEAWNRRVAPKQGLFVGMIAQHPGLAEDLAQPEQEPVLQILATAIAKAATLAGITDCSKHSFTGPQLLMLLNDLTELAIKAPPQPEQDVDYWIKQHTEARQAELELRRELEALRSQLYPVYWKWTANNHVTRFTETEPRKEACYGEVISLCIAPPKQDAPNTHIDAPASATHQATKWVAGVPPLTVDVAWLRVESLGPDDGVIYVVLGCRDSCDDSWFEAGDYKAESTRDAVDDYISHWMPYIVPSVELDGNDGKDQISPPKE